MSTQTQTQLQPTPNLLRPQQIEETKDEVRRIDNMLKDPRAMVEDRPLAQRQLRNMQHMLETQVPTEFVGSAKDNAIAEEIRLREAMIADGMPTQAEMRKAPPGAVNKLLTWEARNKGNLKQWKYLQMRLNVGSTDNDLANFERYRPEGGSHELSMDNALIAGKQYRLPPPGAGPVVVMSDEEKTVLQGLSPELADMMALASNKQRAEILGVVRGIMEETKPEVSTKPPKKTMSAEDRKAFAERMKAGKAKAKTNLIDPNEGTK